MYLYKIWLFNQDQKKKKKKSKMDSHILCGMYRANRKCSLSLPKCDPQLVDHQLWEGRNIHPKQGVVSRTIADHNPGFLKLEVWSA